MELDAKVNCYSMHSEEIFHQFHSFRICFPSLQDEGKVQRLRAMFSGGNNRKNEEIHPPTKNNSGTNVQRLTAIFNQINKSSVQAVRKSSKISSSHVHRLTAFYGKNNALVQAEIPHKLFLTNVEMTSSSKLPFISLKSPQLVALIERKRTAISRDWPYQTVMTHFWLWRALPDCAVHI